ncbi:peptidase [Virgisporangium aliadipatigenens]|uniref:Peptidase n=1 Tax=Virgisporangium aliadipatigenens TaxID=741659 RepID=A0A8J3YUD4_9ACTN|nr:peptidase [Virgisporangium aliadipatigenens]
MAVALSVPVPAAAAPAGAPGPTPPAAATARITLITGDVVALSPAGDGRVAASVTPAPGRERITFHTLEVDGGLRVLPSDVVPQIAAGRLDVDLFDVEELVADGFGDADSPGLPLIVRYGPGARVASRGRALPSIGGAAFTADKTTLSNFWREQTGPQLASSGGIERIWLDGRVKTTLDRSTAQIGAPAAWSAGIDGRGVKVAVLDTGVDQTHPDLTGRVARAENFTDEADTVDRHGHGTHVAATVGGSGAGSGGSRKGVAPGAELLVGKVLNGAGSGYDSWIIAGMEWAAAQGADIVSMSLGGEAKGGSDPMSEAVERLSAQTGTLFVVAAGNAGRMGSIGTPGIATAALTVGAVDRSDALAPFSSQGPRAGDEGLKPDITAPGVGIVAARAAGTSMGKPVDASYTAANGTSMATPHVAGAAALLAQQHPDWNGATLKEALTGTAQPTAGLSAYAQGAGRVDVARATTQAVRGTGTLDLGLYIDTNPAPSTKDITYTNDGNAPVTLTLKLALDNTTTGKAEPDALSIPATVTVPAHGTAKAPVTLDPKKIDRGLHSGRITATAPDGTRVTTAVGLPVDGPRHSVTFRAVDRSGRRTGVPVLLMYGEMPNNDVLNYIENGGELTVQGLTEGDYFLHALIADGGPQDEQVTLVVNPELVLDRDLVVTLDARTGTPIRIETPKPAEQRTILSYYSHRVTPGGRTISHGVMHFSGVRQVNVTPTAPLRRGGSFEFSSRWQLVAPQVSASVPGVPNIAAYLRTRSPVFEGKRRYPLVVDDGRSDVRGRAVLVPAGDVPEDEQLASVATRGAAVALLIRPAGFSAWSVWSPEGEREAVPTLHLPAGSGMRLVERARKGAYLDLTLTPSSPYLYDVFHVERGHIPQRITHTVTARNTAVVHTRYGDQGGFGWAKEQRFGWRPWQEYSWNDTSRPVATGSEREEWVSAGDSLWQHRVSHDWPWIDFGPLGYGLLDEPRTYRGDDRVSESWYAPVVRPAAPPSVVSTRDGDILRLRVPRLVDADGHYDDANLGAVTLSRDGKPLAELPNAWRDVQVPGGTATYRLAMTTARSNAEWLWGTRTETAWTFTSRPVAGPLPLLQVDYDVAADATGRVAARAHTVGFTLRHQRGLAAPRGTSLTVDVSFDEGATWRRVPALGRDGRYAALVPAARAGTSVSLRVSANDRRTGSTVTQTVLRAYGLR